MVACVRSLAHTANRVFFQSISHDISRVSTDSNAKEMKSVINVSTSSIQTSGRPDRDTLTGCNTTELFRLIPSHQACHIPSPIFVPFISRFSTGYGHFEASENAGQPVSSLWLIRGRSFILTLDGGYDGVGYSKREIGYIFEIEIHCEYLFK